MILPINNGHTAKRPVCLKRFWADIAVGAVSAGTIVVHLDILEYRLPQERPGWGPLAENELHLQGVKEALGNGIIIAVALGAHAARQSMFVDQ